MREDPLGGRAERVLLTGHEGYIGSVMVSHLLRAGYDVTGLDVGYFRECTLVPAKVTAPTVRKDIRDLTAADLDGYDAVVHLAALSNDPIGNVKPRWTREINLQASVLLARLAKDAGVKRFLFASSCIMYGMAEATVVTEESPLNPQTEYARSKAEAERGIAALAEGRFSPTFLRNGTVYGLSPRMRFDTVLNDLVGSAATRKRVVVNGDGQPWRPVVHVQDVCRAFVAVMHAPVETVHNQAFNIGADHLNQRIIELAEIAAETVGGCEVEVLSRSGADRRTYRTEFGKFAATFPDFTFDWTAADGARELWEAFQTLGLTAEHFADKRFTRLRWLRHLRDAGRLDGSLRWRGHGEAGDS